MKELNQKYVDVLEKHGWNVVDYTDDERVEIESYSDAGEDLVICADVNDFPKSIMQEYNDFDVEDHVRMWLNAKASGTGGVPGVVELVHDAEDIEKNLGLLADDLIKV